MRYLLVTTLIFATACGSDTEPAEPFNFDDAFLPTQPPEPRPEMDAGEDVGTTSPLLPNGVECDNDSQCESGACLDGVCTQTCETDDDCPANRQCRPVDGFQICTTPLGAADGEACNSDVDCDGGTCIQEWPDGYCTTVGCDTREDCSRQGNDNRCLQNPRGPDLCVRICADDSDCREGYACQLFGNEGFCAPDGRTPIERTIIEQSPFEFTCVAPTLEGLASYQFTVSPTASSYQVTPLNLSGDDLIPLAIVSDDIPVVDLDGTNRFQLTPAAIFGNMNPTIVPATPDFLAQLQPTDHTYEVFTESNETCFYYVEESNRGQTIDLNIYLVGVPGITPASAPQNADLQETLQAFNDIVRAAGIQTGTVRYFELSDPEDVARFSVIRSDEDIATLMTRTQPPGPTVDHVLSANVFFVRAFAVQGGAIGVSQGLPGPAGLHGTQGSGVAFTTEFLGETTTDRFTGQTISGNELTAQVLAHELGHYIGLFHTTEQDGRTHDPINDTPECNGISLECPDINNLMFPFAGVSHIEITPDQAYVFGASMLTK